MAMSAQPVEEKEEFEKIEPVPGVSPATALDDPDKGMLAAEAFARGHEELTDDDERDALDFLLAPKPARLYSVKVEYDTEVGIRPLTFVIAALDGRKIDTIQQSYVNDSTGMLDKIGSDCALVVEATRFLEGMSGRQVTLDSREFLTMRQPNPDKPGGVEEFQLASPVEALEARFKTQIGLIAGVAAQLQQISGFDPRRVGMAQRRLVDAVGKP